MPDSVLSDAPVDWEHVYRLSSLRSSDRSPRQPHGFSRLGGAPDVSILSWQDRVLGWTLGLGDLDDGCPACHGYQNACRCPDCLDREELADAPMRVALPWELDAA